MQREIKQRKGEDFWAFMERRAKKIQYDAKHGNPIVQLISKGNGRLK